ncbi:MAG: hypothetical protein WBC71_05525 [Salaquimonas sp.]
MICLTKTGIHGVCPQVAERTLFDPELVTAFELFIDIQTAGMGD